MLMRMIRIQRALCWCKKSRDALLWCLGSYPQSVHKLSTISYSKKEWLRGSL